MASSLLFVLAAVTVAAAVSLPYHSEELIVQFEEFIKIHNKEYESDIEKAFRFGIFLKTLDFIDHLNKHSDHARFGITQFTDLIDEEFTNRNTGSMQPDFGNDCENVTEIGDINVTETHFDWRDRGVVGPVKNQGNFNYGYGSAFSVIGNVESVNAIKTKNMVSLSEQQLLDCAMTYGPSIDKLIVQSLSYLVSHGSIPDIYYPYLGFTSICLYKKSKVSVKINKCYSIKVPEDALAQKLQEMGPLALGVDSNAIKFYYGGIMKDAYCKGSAINHAVLLVGFGEEDGVPYWTFKNSWGPDWGEEGYFRMQRGVNCCLMTDAPAGTAA